MSGRKNVKLFVYNTKTVLLLLSAKNITVFLMSGWNTRNRNL